MIIEIKVHPLISSDSCVDAADTIQAANDQWLW